MTKSAGPSAGRVNRDDYGAFALGLGPALFVGYLVRWLMPGLKGLGTVVLVALVGAALVRGHRIERARLDARGLGRARGVLLLISTWAIVAESALAARLLLVLAHARLWHLLPGWVDGPIYAAAWLGGIYASVGARDGVWRWAILGCALCLVAVFMPALSATHRHAYLAAALLMGGVLSISGYYGHQSRES